LNDINHVASKGSAGGDGARCVDEGYVVAHVVEDGHEVGVGCAAPVGLDLNFFQQEH
jgi:hypothetical protein